MKRMRRRAFSRAFSMVGLLVTMVCMVILFAIGMSAMNKAVTGEGSAVEGTVRSVQDQLALYTIATSMVTFASDHGGRFLTPSELSGSGDVSQNTTASLYSAMIMENYVSPDKLVSGNEYNGWVVPIEDYDFLARDPGAGIYWDPTFEADLEDYSNVSFAHMPLCGDRFERHWETSFSSRMPIFGNRGPKDGIENPDSYTYGRNGRWGGHLAFGDGHTEFVETFTPSGLFLERDGRREQDNIFAMQDGAAGRDAIIAFTKAMSEDGPELQYD